MAMFLDNPFSKGAGSSVQPALRCGSRLGSGLRRAISGCAEDHVRLGTGCIQLFLDESGSPGPRISYKLRSFAVDCFDILPRFFPSLGDQVRRLLLGFAYLFKKIRLSHDNLP
jgi:hypothetical protein